MSGSITIGLTGGIASGKSTVARWLAEAGLEVIDADELVAQLYQSGEAGAEVVRELFGADALDATGVVDHARLAARVFSDPQALDALEERIHPLVRDRFAAMADGSSNPTVLEATLLIEAGYAQDFDLVVTVEAAAEERIQRAIARGLSETEARARFEAQADRRFREQAAHRIVPNDGSLEDLRNQVNALLDEIRALEARRQG
jgi:dephospho-CoA kinase